MFFVRLATRLLKVALTLTVMLALAWYFREPVLRSIARAWVVNDPVSKADAIVVLGGGRDWRPFAAAEMYKAGEAPVVLVAQPEKSPSQSLLQQTSEGEVNTTILTVKGVPPASIQPLGEGVTSTRDEAVALRNWVVTHQAKDVIIPTDAFHTRRVQWIFQRELAGTGVTVHVRSVSHPNYSTDTWWLEEEGFLGFQSEVMKSLYYLVRY